MTKDQFQRETNNYMTRHEHEARAKAAEYNAQGVDGETIVAAQYGGFWCLMLSNAHDFAKSMGIGQ